jgi:Kef-type K+ transport system membrane component KefB
LVKLLLELFLVLLFWVLNKKILFFLNKLVFFEGQIPAWTNAIWPASSIPTFELIANLGLIFFMFFLGVELDLEQIKRTWKITIPIACASIIVPGKY